jgi:hypothetical protein
MDRVSSGNQNSVQIQVAFSKEWAVVPIKSATFYTLADKTVYEVLLEDNQCIIPHEVLENPGELMIGIRGVNPEGQVIKATTLVKYRVEKGAPAGNATTDGPTPDVYQQILTKLGEIHDPVVIGQIVEEYLAENPPPPSNPVSYEELKNAVFEYLSENEINSLPEVSSADNGKLLGVTDGKWGIVELPVYDGEYAVTPKADDSTTLETAQKYMTQNVNVRKIPYYEVDNAAGGATIYIGTDDEIIIE